MAARVEVRDVASCDDVRRRRIRIFLVATVALVLSAIARDGAAQPAPIVIEDGFFAGSDWDPPTEFINNGSSQTFEHLGSDGHPGAYRYMTHGLPPSSSISVYHYFTGDGGSYDPSKDGAIAAITYSEDHIEYDPPFNGAAVGALFFIAQDDRIHFGPDLTFTSTTWTHVKQPCLRPDQFTMSGGLPPDFSANGHEIRFGFLRSNSNISESATLTIKHGIDNFRVVIFREPNPDCVGEPAELTLDKTDNGHNWGDAPLIPYQIDLSNGGGTATDATLIETVPEKTTFVADGSTPGWQCDPGTGAGSECSLPVGALGPQETRSFAFNVRVADGTDPKWEVYNEVRTHAESASTPQPLRANVNELVFHDLLAGWITPNGCNENTGTAIACCVWCFFFPCDCCEALSPHGDCSELCTAPSFVGGQPGAALATASSDPFLLYRLRDRTFAGTRGGQRATGLYYLHSGDIIAGAMADPSIVPLAATNLLAWQPNLRALVAGEGDSALVTQAQIDGLDAFLDALRAVANGDLAHAIDRERPRLGLDQWPGISMTEALHRLDGSSCEGYEDVLFCGELTGDCNITASDALAALQMAVGSRTVNLAGDMDASGGVTAADALKILRIAVSLDTQTTACNGV